MRDFQTKEQSYGKASIIETPEVSRSASTIPLASLMRIAVQDLFHERLLSLCHILACAAALAPLLLLFGMRNGAIETMRTRLLQDPRNKEIRPVFGQSFTRNWFRTMSDRQDVAFIVPQIRQIALGVEARLQAASPLGSEAWADLDVVPTDKNDPLFTDNGLRDPDQGQCVLSAAAAEALGAVRGDVIALRVGRAMPAGRETQMITRQVSGVLPPRATTLRLVYLPLDVVEAVENYKDGLAVPRFGWLGQSDEVPPLYDGVLIFGTTPLDKVTQAELLKNTGLTKGSTLSSFEADPLGYPLSDGSHCWVLTSPGNLVGDETLATVRRRLKSPDQTAIPFTLPRVASLSHEGASVELPARIVGVPVSLLIKMKPDYAFHEQNRLVAFASPELIRGPGAKLKITNEGGDHSLTVPLALLPTALRQGDIWLPVELAGRLNTLRDRPLKYDELTRTIRPLRRSYTSFRLYARTLEDVLTLTRGLQDSGISVNAATDRIADVLGLERNLGILFWLVASVAMVGGLLTLVASLYASIERKRRDLGVLRLLGVPLGALSVFPVTQAVTVGVAALGLSLCLYSLGAFTIDAIFIGHLQEGQQLCSVKLSHVAVTAALTLVIAVTAGLLACSRIARQDPAQTLREE